ncbi:hypothetical protein HQ945_08480 [Phyllobacterium sp. BT25]|uniref:Uncharacterized protein n=1 Tax=Phyllobacterium pellucidum TaxID=2740464 RepID=A0A849VTC2_9HYPH|nr:hypothetical protein [Phyllobacterium pellucidum]NTS31290.1 hypothetical protein [Phyllobacterium pellucidum]
MTKPLKHAVVLDAADCEWLVNELRYQQDRECRRLRTARNDELPQINQDIDRHSRLLKALST